jgi:glycosyltransferase family protein
MTRPHLAYKDENQASVAFTLLKRLWEGFDIVTVEGSKTRLGVGNDLLSSARTIRRILCPAEHAFMSYDKIRSAILTHVSKDKLLLLSLGPTAKVLGLELFQLGYRVIDIGHIDMEYEMFLRNEPLLKKVPYKYFNEINERDPVDCKDLDYLQQIITSIE